MSFHSRESFSVSFFHVRLGPLPPSLPAICISHAVLTAPLECSMCPNQRILLFKMRSRYSSSSFASSSLDLTVATSSSLILQICLIMALSDHGPVIALQVRLGQWPSFTGMEHGAPHSRAVYMAKGLVRAGRDVRTGSRSLNLFQAVFKQVVTVISQPPPAESINSYSLKLV